MWFNIKKLGYLGLMIISLVAMTGFVPAQDSIPAGEEPYVRITQVDTSQFPQVTVYVSVTDVNGCLLYTSPSPRDATLSRMPSSA